MANNIYRPFRISSDKKWLKIDLDALELNDTSHTLFSTVPEVGSRFTQILRDFIEKHKQAAKTYGRTLVPFMENWTFIVDALCFEALVRWWNVRDTPLKRIVWTAEKYMISREAAKQRNFSKPTLVQRAYPNPNFTDLYWEYAYKMIFKLYGPQLGFPRADAVRQRNEVTRVLKDGLRSFVHDKNPNDTWRITAANAFSKNPDVFINQEKIGEQIHSFSSGEKQALLEHAIRNGNHELVTLVASHI
jgi:hypothetical protein